DAAKGPRAAKAPAPGRAAKTQLVAASGGPYWVQVGAFHAEAHAKALAARLRGADFPAEVVAGGGGASAAGGGPAVSPPAGGGGAIYRVRVGGFPDRTAADDARKALTARGYTGFIGRGGG